MAEPKTTAAPPESPNPIKATRPNPPSSLQSSAGAFATRRRPDPRFLTADSMRFGRCYPTRLELRGAVRIRGVSDPPPLDASEPGREGPPAVQCPALPGEAHARFQEDTSCASARPYGAPGPRQQGEGRGGRGEAGGGDATA